jgi:hypothetical protein
MATITLVWKPLGGGVYHTFLLYDDGQGGPIKYTRGGPQYPVSEPHPTQGLGNLVTETGDYLPTTPDFADPSTLATWPKQVLDIPAGQSPSEAWGITVTPYTIPARPLSRLGLCER